MTYKEKQEEKKRISEKMRVLRANMSDIEIEKVKEKDKERKKRQQEAMSDVEKEFERIDMKHKKRSLRKQRNGKMKLEENLQAKKGMRLLREKG